MSAPTRQEPRGANGDEALVEALGLAARAMAARDARGGPSPSAWYRLARTRAARADAPFGGRRPVRAALLAAGVACVGVVVVGAFAWRAGGGRGGAGVGEAPLTGAAARAPLTYSVQGASSASGDEIDAGERADTAVRFSDGTEVALFKEARLTVTGRAADGARLRLRAGRARFEVVHRPRAAWTVDAGPYVIEVTGTVFEVRWSRAEQRVEVKMQSGAVRVSGPLLSERMTLRTGQRLVVRPAAGEVHLDDTALTHEEAEEAAGPGGPWDPEPDAPVRPPAAASSASPRPSPAAPVSPPGRSPLRPRLAFASPHPLVTTRGPLAPGAPAPAPDVGASTPSAPPVEPEPLAAPSVRPQEEVATAATALRPVGVPAPAAVAPGRWAGRGWAARVATGDSRAVLADAEQIGVEATLAGADAPDLSALADAARYGGRSELADRALIETRRRFPGSTRAKAAAFLLGRVADDRGDPQTGLAWYRRYLEEAPGGPYAAEALGREMLAVEGIRGRRAAAPLAAEYLRRFPNGTYLLRARALVDDR